MILEKKGDLIQALKDGDINIAVHCCNLYHTMRAGLAKKIALEFPEAEEVDKKTPRGELSKLGSYSVAKVGEDKYVVNLYGQIGIGCDDNPLNRNARYDAIYDGLFVLKERLLKQETIKNPRIGFPYKMASDLAGGDFRIVKSIIDSVFESTDFEVTIFSLTGNLSKIDITG